MHRWRMLLVAAGLLAGGAVPAAGQPGGGNAFATRAELVATADSLEALIVGGRLRGKTRERAVADVAALRHRLEEGDFQVGDRFLLTILHDNAITDSVLVREGGAVSIASLPDTSVRGVLRSELSSHLSAHVAHYLKNATVRTQVLTRVSVTGQVARPGYHYLAPNRPFSELLTAAGGLSPQSRPDGIEVRRNGRVAIGSRALRGALRDGLTLEQLDIRAGDEVVVPVQRRLNWQLVLQLVFIVSSLLFAYLRFLEWYYREDA